MCVCRTRRTSASHTSGDMNAVLERLEFQEAERAAKAAALAHRQAEAEARLHAAIAEKQAAANALGEARVQVIKHLCWL